MFSEFSPYYAAMLGFTGITGFYFAKFRAPSISFKFESQTANGFRVTDIGFILRMPRRDPAAKSKQKEICIYFTSKS